MTNQFRNPLGQGLALMFCLAMAPLAQAGMLQDSGTPMPSAAAGNSVFDRIEGDTPAQRQQGLIERARKQGMARVIVQTRESPAVAFQTMAQVQSQRAVRRQDILRRVGMGEGLDRAAQPVRSFSLSGDFALWARESDIRGMLGHAEVTDVVEDAVNRPSLAQSMPLIGATGWTFTSGGTAYSGLGQVVAILDTGVDKNHVFLTGKVVSEACYSTNYPIFGIYSLCPGSVTASTAPGSGVNCDVSQYGSGCQHGTHVAGIATGKGTSLSGVARDANLIAIQVFTGFSASQCGGTTPCVGAYDSDIIKGLERVHTLRSTLPVASANLSLGGGKYTAPCDGDAVKPAIDQLRSIDVATVIASGNESYTNALSAPACISSAVSVGASCDAAGGYCTAVDTVASYSNSASFLSLLAPGSVITSSIPGNLYASWNGTSMATPHVAGAWAVLKQKQPAADVDTVLKVLKDSGLPVTDPRNGITTPRIRLALALDSLDGTTPTPEPLAVPVNKPATDVKKSSFQANWTAATGATGYKLDVSTRSNFSSYVTGYNNLDVVPSDPSVQSISRVVSGLKAKTTYYVRVRAYNDSETSANSNTISVRTLR